MNPHKLNKVDVSGMTEQEQKAFKMYGKVPAKNLLTKMQKDRKYFDSGDYMMNKAGVGNAQPLGTAIPTPEGVPHASPPGPNSPGILSSSPTGNASAPMTIPAVGGPESNPSTHAQAQPIGVPGSQSFGSSNQLAQPLGVPGQQSPFTLQHRGSVGVGIAPAEYENQSDTPHQATHGRRPSESGHRISPPGTLRETHNHPSSYPIQHHGSFGASSPVKASSLARRLDEDM